jgi:ABC-type sugar transport system ATPase subunit
MTLGERIGVMERGELRQVGTPEELYRRPACAFVASFIGSPGMNLIHGEMRGGRFRWQNSGGNGDAAGGELPIDDGVVDAKATLGVRPENLLLNGGGAPLAEVMIDAVERLGHETLAYFRLAGGHHVSRLPGDMQVRAGDRVQFRVPPETLHLFGADGRRLN